jgi:hypothetical protein
MFFNKAKQFDNEPTRFSSINSLAEQKPVANGKNLSNVVPLEHPKPGLNATMYSGFKDGYEDATADDGAAAGAATAEIKARVEGMLSRIKSEVAMNEMDTANVETTTSIPDEPVGSTAGYSLKSVKAELERRRSELYAAASSAEAKAREAEERFQQVERKLAEETEKRLVMEQRFRDLEDEYLQRLSATEAEEFKLLESQVAREEAETRLKEAESRLKEAEARTIEESEKLAQRENALIEAEEKAKAASSALEEAQRKSSEAENRARAAVRNVREIEALFDEVEAVAQAAQNRYKAAEARLRRESELRVLAERKLKALEDELGSYLDLDLSKVDFDATRNGFIPGRVEAKVEAKEDTSGLRAQIESEQTARLTAEKARTAAEAKVDELAEKLQKLEEKHRQAETGFKKVVRDQEAQLRSLSEQAPYAKDASAALSLIDHAGEDFSHSGTAEMAGRAKVRLVSYSAVITLLVVALCWLIVTAYHQL